MHYPGHPLLAATLAADFVTERQGAAVRSRRPSRLSALVSRASARRHAPPVISPAPRVTARAGR